MLSWDTETRNFRWWENSAFLGSWDRGQGGYTASLLNSRKGRLAAALKKDKVLVGHNAKFDAHMTREALGLDVLDPKLGYTVHDTATMSRLVYGVREPIHGLKELSVKYIDPDAAEAEKIMQERYHAMSGRTSMEYDDAYYDLWKHSPGDRAIVEKYAARDAELTLALFEFLEPQIEADPKLSKLYKLETQVQTVLYNAERIGVNVDPKAVERLAVDYDRRTSEAEAALMDTLGFIPEGEGSTERLRERLPELGVKLTERTEKSGELAVNRKALQPFADHPAVAALFEWRRVHKFQTTYLRPLRELDDGAVHTNFKQAEAWTGRMASGTPNLQNLPKRTDKQTPEDLRVRSVFVPRPGFEFHIYDYEGIEMRVLAHFIGDPQYAKIIANGDPHAITAAAVWGGRPEDYYKGTDKRFLRDIAKHATFGIVYGGGGPVVMDTINRMVVDAGRPDLMVSLDQARGVRKKITGAIPGFKGLTDTPWQGKKFPSGRIHQQLLASQEGDYGYVRTIGGRKNWISLEKAYVGLSGLVQGSAADIMKIAAVNLFEALKPEGAYPLLFVHDEAVIEAPKGMGKHLEPIITEAMVSAADLLAPLKVEGHVTDRSYAHVG